MRVIIITQSCNKIYDGKKKGGRRDTKFSGPKSDDAERSQAAKGERMIDEQKTPSSIGHTLCLQSSL